MNLNDVKSSENSNGNAYKFLSEELQDQEDQQYIKIKLDITDTGCGIAKENLGKLFMDFGKLDEHSKINAQGTGLGLSICKKMIEKMGGTVHVDSIVGEGTTFTVQLILQSKIAAREDD